jgi:hypothetical protein
MLIKILTIILLLLPATAGCSEDAEMKVRETFDIPKHISLSEVSIRDAVIKKIPLGTTEKNVYRILRELKIGANSFSSFYPADEKGEIVCRFEFNTKDYGVVKKHYGVIFQLDDKRLLKNVIVNEWRTGL